MAQLRQDLSKFTERGIAVVVIGPEDAKKFAKYFSENKLPFIGLPDPKHQVLKQYGQEINLFKLGRMPAQLLVDKEGIVRFVHYGKSMADIPPNEEIFEVVDGVHQVELVTA